MYEILTGWKPILHFSGVVQIDLMAATHGSVPVYCLRSVRLAIKSTMARPLRIDFPNAMYRMMARENGRQAIANTQKPAIEEAEKLLRNE